MEITKQPRTDYNGHKEKTEYSVLSRRLLCVSFPVLDLILAAVCEKAANLVGKLRRKPCQVVPEAQTLANA